jgi:endonuclease YncB( thermonuclease family)
MKYLAKLWPNYIFLFFLASMLFMAGCNQGLTLNQPANPAPQTTFVLPTGGPTADPTPISTRVVPLDSLTPAPTRTITPIPDEVRGLVVEVIDGDTITVVLEGDLAAVAHEVRYIGIDAPPNTPRDPWGVVAYETNQRLVGLKVVRLVRDQTELDEEGRLLRYVFTDNQLTSILLAEQGLAEAAPSADNTQYETEISEAEQSAQEANLGIWGDAPPTPTSTRGAAPAASEDEATSEPAETAEPTDEADTTPASTPGTPTSTTEAEETDEPETTGTPSPEASETPPADTTPTQTVSPEGTASPTTEGTSEADDS